MKLMKTQGASDAMQMAHYKLTIIIIIKYANVEINCLKVLKISLFNTGQVWLTSSPQLSC